MSEKEPISCKDKARQWVHITALGGAALATAPVPGMGTVGLTVLEATLVYWVGRIYGEKLDKTEVLMVAGALEVGSLGIKAGVLELLNFVPVVGWIVKAPIALGIIEGIGALAIDYFEDKYPNRMYTTDPDVEESFKSKKK